LSYTVPITTNNRNTVIYDLNLLADDVLKITGNKSAYDEFVNKINQSIYNKDTLKKILFNQSKPYGFLERIRLETNNYDMFDKITCLGFDYTNEMSDINVDIRPAPSLVAGRLVCDYDIPVWEETTQERIIRNANRITIINSFRVFGLIGMLNEAAKRKYTTTDDIKEVRNKISNVFETIIDNDETRILIPDIKQSMQTQFDRTLEVLTQKEQNAYNTTTIKLERKYASQLISYQLYGELIKNETDLNNFSDIIKGLNRQEAAHALNGEIRIIQV